MKKLISVVTPCFNEELNVEDLAKRVRLVMLKMDYEYEHIFIDNHSTDTTYKRLKEIALRDSNIKIIRNVSNFGTLKSPHHALLESNGDACILLPSDLQEPPELIPKLIEAWEHGFKIALLTKTNNSDTFFRNVVKRIYYRSINLISEIDLVENASGWGLVDRRVIEIIRKLDDPYPHYRGLLCEIGFPIAKIDYEQIKRERGVSKINLMTLYDTAMQGIVHFSKVPLRIMSIVGLSVGIISLLCSLLFLILKLLFWESFQLGIAPTVIGVFFFGGIQLFSIGILAEYIFSIHTKIRKMPLVVEEERINF